MSWSIGLGMFRKSILVIEILGSVAIASAETVKVQNFNICFNMSQPYEITMPQSAATRNGSHSSQTDEIFINSS